MLNPSGIRSMAKMGLALVVLLASSSAGATIFIVNTFDDELLEDGDCSLREAIQAANTDLPVDACGPGTAVDTILVPAGTFNLTLPGAAPEDANASGDLDLRADITIRGIGATRTIIDNQNAARRVLHVRCSDTTAADIDVEIENVEIRGGVQDIGGGLLIEDCSNGSSTGESNVILSNFRAHQNTATVFGGGIADMTGGFVTIRDSHLSANQLYAELTGAGVGYGAGLSIAGGGLTTVEDSLIEDGLAYDFIDDSSAAGVFVTSPTNIYRSVIRDNVAFDDGGGVFCVDTAMNIDHTTITGNQASGGVGGGIYAASGCTISLDSVTIAENYSLTGGGIYVAPGGTPILENTIVALNGATSSPDVSGPVNSDDYNIVGIVDGSSGVVEPNDLTGTGALPLDPGLLPLAYHGRPSPSYYPIAGGPALDNGATPKFEDQHGTPRPQNGVDDRGAVELEFVNSYYYYYVDLSIDTGVPSSAFGAAAAVPGVWNGVGLGAHSLVDGSGAPSSVTLTVSSDQDVTLFSSGVNDAAKLLADDVFDCTGAAAGETWSLSFSGLPLNDYVVYLYAPQSSPRATGDITINGAPSPPALTGGSLALIENDTYRSTPIHVANGMLDISGVETTPTDCAGIAGVQVVPEPGSGVGLIAGGLGLAAASARRRRGIRDKRGSGASPSAAERGFAEHSAR